MSEPINPSTPEIQGDPEALGNGGKKALAAERAERKAAETRAAELEKQINDLQATHQQELEAANTAATDATQRAEQAETKSLRYLVALEEGVPAKHIGRLQGGTEEELRADAATFVADIAPGPTSPKPDLSQGAAAGQVARSMKPGADTFAAGIRL